MRIHRTFAVLVLAAGLAACGGKAGDDGVASSNGKAGKGAKASPSRSLDPRAAQLKYAQCMRSNGVDMKDPDPNQKGVRIAGKRMNQGKMQAAMQKCQQYLQAGGLAKGPDDPKVRDQMLRLAQCIRQHGVNIPDPKPGQPFTVGGRRGDTAKIAAAMKACRQYAPGGGR